MCKLGAVSQERLKIEVKLLLSANRKSYMSRRLAQQRMTLTDLGWPFRGTWIPSSSIWFCLVLCSSAVEHQRRTNLPCLQSSYFVIFVHNTKNQPFLLFDCNSFYKHVRRIVMISFWLPVCVKFIIWYVLLKPSYSHYLSVIFPFFQMPVSFFFASRPIHLSHAFTT